MKKRTDNYFTQFFTFQICICIFSFSAGNIIGQGCNVDQCQTKNSYCDTGVSPAICRCQHSYTKNFEASQCLSIYMAGM